MRKDDPLRVICLDDESDILALLEVAAEFQPDFEIVATTSDPFVVIDLIREHQPDVLILDHRLAETLAPDHPRATADTVSTTIVAVTRTCAPDATIAVFTGREVIRDAKEDVGDVWVQKPHLEDLWPAIRDSRRPKD